jgi:hypothetical protein
MLIRHHWDGRFSRATRALGRSATGRSLLAEAHERRISCRFVAEIGQAGALGTYDHATHCCDILDSADEAALPLVLVDLISRGLEQTAAASPDDAHWAELLVAREMAEAGVPEPLGWYMRVPGDIGHRLRRASMVMLSAELVGREAAPTEAATAEPVLELTAQMMLRQVG